MKARSSNSGITLLRIFENSFKLHSSTSKTRAILREFSNIIRSVNPSYD